MTISYRFREQAQRCRELAELMSHPRDRDRLIDSHRRLGIAEEMEAEHPKGLAWTP